MKQRYMIEAWSPSLMQTQCQLNLLDQTHDVITDRELAQRMSDTFAYSLNQQRKEHAQDWVGTPRLVTYGEETFPGAQAHNIVQNQQL